MRKRSTAWAPDAHPSRSKKYFMIQFWRMQQSQAFVNSFFFATTLALLLMPYLGVTISEVTGNVLLTFWVLFTVVMGAILGFGYAFDNVWRLWKEQVVVGTERNPYALEKLSAKEVVVWRHLHLPMLRATGQGNHAHFMEAWMGAAVAEDPKLDEDVRQLEDWLVGTADRSVGSPLFTQSAVPAGEGMDLLPKLIDPAGGSPVSPVRR